MAIHILVTQNEGKVQMNDDLGLDVIGRQQYLIGAVKTCWMTYQDYLLDGRWIPQLFSPHAVVLMGWIELEAVKNQMLRY